MTDEEKKLIDDLDRLRMPEGMQQRISDAIDRRAAVTRRRRILTMVSSAAACLTVVVASFWAFRQAPANDGGELSQEEALYYTQMALSKFTSAMGHSLKAVEITESSLDRTNEVIENIL